MSITANDFSDVIPQTFVRCSKARRNFRINNRYNPALPPAARIYMKAIEQKSIVEFEESKYYQTKIEEAKENIEEEEEVINCQAEWDDDEQRLINKTPVLERRPSIKKLKMKIKVVAMLSIFKKPIK